MKVAPEHPWGLSVRVSASIADFVLTTRAIFKPAWSMPVAAIAGSRRSAAGKLNLAFNAVSAAKHKSCGTLYAFGRRVRFLRVLTEVPYPDTLNQR